VFWFRGEQTIPDFFSNESEKHFRFDWKLATQQHILNRAADAYCFPGELNFRVAAFAQVTYA
jgi:hypothetical protein